MNYFIVLLLIVLDQMTKMVVQNRFELYESVPVIKNIFHLTYVQNVGAAFGILQNQKLFFVIITTVVISGIIMFIRTQNNIHRVAMISLNMIIAGAVGNLIDRIRLGYVIDFFDFRIWPVFNIADCAIVVGAILLSYYMIFIDRLES